MLGRARKKKQRKGRASEQSIDRSGHQIYEKGGQIKALTDRRWDVESQSREGVTYRCRSAAASLPASHMTGKWYRCRHTAAVEHMLLRDHVIP